MEPLVAPEPVAPPIDPYLAEESEMLDYQKASTEISMLLSKWRGQKTYAEVARRTRFIEANVETLQQQGILKSDETFIPCRVIDANIRKEQPAYVNFLINSRRLVTFKDANNFKSNTQQLEDEFTSGMRYNSWEIPLFKEIDGAQTFGWDSVEVEFDLDKPLQCGINHIGNENLIFPTDSKDLQGSEMIAVRYEFTRLVLRKFVKKYAFNRARVDEILQIKDGKLPSNIEVFKIYMKIDGIVYVAWYGKGVTGWLKDPEKLYLGVKRRIETPPTPETEQAVQLGLLGIERLQTSVIWEKEDETEYPIRILVYNISEQPCITHNRGRVFLDQTKQESQTAMFSSLVNGCIRASNVYSYVDGNPEGGAPRQLDMEMVHGRVFNTKIGFFQAPWPDAMLLKAAQALDTQTQSETGQVNFAVNNRQDSRKTATEISAAQQQSMLLSSTQVSLFSNHIQEVYALAWRIVQSRALQGEISFMQTEQTNTMTGQTDVVNDEATISKTYIIKAAGDVDVIERDEKLKTMLTLWPIYQTTGCAQMYLNDITRLAFPNDSARYIQVMEQQNQTMQLLASVGEALRVAVTDESGAIKPEFAQNKEQLMQLEQQVQSVLQPQ